MSALRSIISLLLVISLIGEPSLISVSAQSDAGAQVHSLEELQIGANIEQGKIARTVTQSGRSDISELIRAKSEYQNGESTETLSRGFIIDPFRENIIPSSLIVPEVSSGVLLSNTFSDFITPGNMPLISGKKSKKIRTSKMSREERKVGGTRGKIAVNIGTGTLISSLSGEIIDPTTISIGGVDSRISNQARSYHESRNGQKKKNKNSTKGNEGITNMDVFEFGIPGTHLVFSRPVTLSIATPGYSDGIIVDLATLHAGDTGFNTAGLSTSPDTLCSTDGSASKPGSQGIVKNGKVTFYTCGASSFTMNVVGGVASSNDLKIIIGDYGQTQIYYNGLTQVYGGNPPASGAGGPTWPRLRIGTVNIGNGATAWTTATTTGSQVGNVYNATTVMTYLLGSLTYTLTINWSYTAPNKFFTWTYKLQIPVGNTQNVKFYYGQDSYVAGGDANDTGYISNTGGLTVGIYDSAANILSAQRYLSGQTWAGYIAGPYGTVSTQTNGGSNYNNTIQTTGGDLGYGINWDFGTATSGTYTSTTEWRVLPYVSANVVDLIPGIGQPQGPLTVNTVSTVPITISNAGQATSTGVTTLNLNLPTGINGPGTSFVDNGWSCGVAVASIVTCTKSATIAPLGSDTVNIPVTPTATVQGSTLTFSTSISNAGDSNTTNNGATVTLQVAVAATPNVTPGGVAGSSVWLQAGSGLTLSGTNITSWADISGQGNNATQATSSAQPVFSANSLNGNPVVQFNSTAQHLQSTKTGSYQTVFAVRNLVATGYQYLFSAPAGGGFALRAYGAYNGTTIMAYTDGPNSGDWSYSGSLAINGLITNTGKKGYHLVRATSATSIVGQTYGISSTFLSRGMTGGDGVGEVIVYPGTISTTNTNRIESYLGIKYGITLDQTTATNYTLSDGSIVWNSSVAGTYKNDIAGIARDDISRLNQKKSQSINNTGDIIISAPNGINTNLLSLMWSNNGSATGTLSITDAPTGTQRISRRWFTQSPNGNMGTVVISYPANALPAGWTGTPLLFTDMDGVFASGSSNYVGVYNTGTLSWDFTLSLLDRTYITIGKTVPADTIAPVITSISIASGSLLPIGTFPLTVTYSDTGSAINPASLTGKIYTWTGGAWSTTNIANTYMILDGSPSTSTGAFKINGLPFGKYRFDISVADNVGNTITQSYTYFVDAIEWSVSSDQYDIGTMTPGVQTFGPGEMIVTVKTLGVPFVLNMVGTNTLAQGSQNFNYWNGSLGWGYNQFLSGTYNTILVGHATSATIAMQARSMDQNGMRNVYTYKIKFGGKSSYEQAAGIYQGNISFSLTAHYQPYSPLIYSGSATNMGIAQLAGYNILLDPTTETLYSMDGIAKNVTITARLTNFSGTNPYIQSDARTITIPATGGLPLGGWIGVPVGLQVTAIN